MSALSIENSIQPVDAASLNQQSILNNSGTELNQADFIELLVAQVKNQDPTKPMEPNQFMSQLAQFSTVNGVTELKTAFDSLADKLASDQSIQAAGLVGRSVLVPGGKGVLDNSGSVSGQIHLPDSSTDVKLKVYNASGEEIRTLPLGVHSSGNVQFQWDGFMDSGNAAPQGQYTIVADALIDGNTTAVEVSVETRVDSITLDQDAAGTPAGTVLNLASGETVSLNSVQQIK